MTDIYSYRVMEWYEVDQQSLILKIGFDEYYLLVLKIPSYKLLFMHRIGITGSTSMIMAGFDRVKLYYPSSFSNSYTIERIYRIKGSE